MDVVTAWWWWWWGGRLSDGSLDWWSHFPSASIRPWAQADAAPNLKPESQKAFRQMCVQLYAQTPCTKTDPTSVGTQMKLELHTKHVNRLLLYRTSSSEDHSALNKKRTNSKKLQQIHFHSLGESSCQQN